VAGDPIRLAVVGAGWAGMRQVEAAAELNDTMDTAPLEVTALVDIAGDFARKRAADAGIPTVYTDLADALADDAIDAVSICLPHHLHSISALAAAEAKKHVLVEKPMAMNVDEGRGMMEAAAANGVVLFVAENEVYHPMTQHLRELVSAGTYVGEVTFAAMTTGFRSPGIRYPGRRDWLTDPSRGGTGMWMLQGIHTAALVRHTLGEVKSVYMTEHKAASFERPELEGTMTGQFTLESGVGVWVAQTTETWLPGALNGWRIHGDEGSIIANADGFEVLSESLTHETFGVELDEEMAAKAGQHGQQFPPRPDIRSITMEYPPLEMSDYALELKAFAETIRGTGGGPTTAVSELRTLAVVQAGYESAAGAGVVDMAQRFPDLYEA